MTKKDKEDMHLYIMIGVLVVLVLMTGAQAFQIDDLEDSITQLPKAQSVDTQTENRVGSGGSAIPTNLQDLPQMVGGC